MLQPYERLKKVFEDHRERIVRRFGISFDLARKWMRDTDDMGTGRANPLQRVRDLIDEALIVDPTGEGAYLIARDAIEYYESLTQQKIQSLNQVKEADELLGKSVEVVRQLNIHDVRRMSKSERRELSEKLSELNCATAKLTAWLNSEDTNARQFIPPRRERASS